MISRDIALKQGTHAREGDPLLLVADHTEKELIAVVDQDSIEEIRPAVGTSFWIRSANFASTRGRLDRIDPRASDQLPEESLAATEGGPLGVRGRSEQDHQDDQPYRLLAPHFRTGIHLEADVAREIPAGMGATASLGYRSDTIATRVQKLVRRLWYRAQDGAIR